MGVSTVSGHSRWGVAMRYDNVISLVLFAAYAASMVMLARGVAAETKPLVVIGGVSTGVFAIVFLLWVIVHADV